MDFSHIMLDLETLDVKPTAVVVSIGAVAFDPYSPALGEAFYVELTIPSKPGEPGGLEQQQTAGCTVGASTAQWWLQQSDEARTVFAKDGLDSAARLQPAAALMQFSQFIARHGGPDAEIWGNGADFDNVILGNLYRTFGYKQPWSFGKNRCFRTMNALPEGKDFQKPKRGGVHHHALDDAVYQARVLQEIVKCHALR